MHGPEKRFHSQVVFLFLALFLCTSSARATPAQSKPNLLKQLKVQALDGDGKPIAGAHVNLYTVSYIMSFVPGDPGSMARAADFHGETAPPDGIAVIDIPVPADAKHFILSIEVSCEDRQGARANIDLVADPLLDSGIPIQVKLLPRSQEVEKSNSRSRPRQDSRIQPREATISRKSTWPSMARP